jgi:hypothetical protein
MRTILSCVSLLVFSVSSVNADPIVSLDFNDLQVDEEVLGYYNGGLGSLGTGPGPALGITFTSDFVTVPFGVFGPPDLSEQLTTDSGIMNVAAGFSGGFSFYYANSGSLLLYSGLDGTGSLVGSLALPDGGFGATGLEQLIPFESAVFSGNGLMLDNITFGPFGFLVTPEPSSISLLWIGLAAIFIALRRVRGLELVGCKNRALK